MLSLKLEETLRTTKKHINLLKSLDITTIRDFLLYFPRTYNDTSTYTKVKDIRPGEVNTLKGQITSLFNITSRHGRKLTRGIFTDQTGSIDLIWFNQPHLTRLLPRGKEIVLTGKAKHAMGRISLQGPKHEILKKGEEQIHSGRIVPVYPETEGINSNWIREKIKPLIDQWASLFQEYLPETIIQEHQLISYSQAIKNIHFPENAEKLKQARTRLAFDELFLLQLKAIQNKWHYQNQGNHHLTPIPYENPAVKQAIANLPFQLTNAQKRTLKEITDDLKQTFPMRRLVQGDVGSGKTIVAALMALHVVTNGYQVALMAPTEILAKQHYKTFLKTLKEYNLNIQFIAGSTTNKSKQEIITQMTTGTADIIIGTHALIQDKISFNKLGLAIIDEQHRFGVKQRDTLKSFGTPHLLSMTATPIPRTLAITMYGDQDLSIIDEMPAGRQEIFTRLVPETKRQQAYHWIEDQINKGRQAFVICPLIEESETLEVKSVTEEYDKLTAIFPQLTIALLHGKLPQDQKDQIMADFAANKINLLVSTSVIEVGINVPNATIMLIEGAERFGLAQLHQFRGRVGRGEHKSYCFLFPSTREGEKSTRLKAMEKHHSGFKLSEIDLELRGPGEVYGVRQSGLPDLQMANLSDIETISKARESAIKLIEQDPKLELHPILASKIA